MHTHTQTLADIFGMVSHLACSVRYAAYKIHVKKTEHALVFVLKHTQTTKLFLLKGTNFMIFMAEYDQYKQAIDISTM